MRVEKRALYLECSSGISGDMIVAALLDLGANETRLRETLDSLPLAGYRIEITDKNKSGIRARDFNVVLDRDNRDHDMAYLHGHDSSAQAYHAHDHHHEHRGMKEITKIIEAGNLSERARSLAFRIFEILAAAEAKAHGVSVDQVHFHEVGAVDSIVDIAAAAVCLDDLQIRDVIIPSLTEGSGTIRCQHGILPVPVPAVANICAAHGLELSVCAIRGELVTPTGAAFAAAVRTGNQLPEKFRILRTGTGAGKREYECPGILRAHLIENTEADREGTMADQICREGTAKDLTGREGATADQTDRIVRLETNVDDMTGEALGFLQEELLAHGARDAFWVPIYMKKNRPAWLLQVLCDEEHRQELETLIFRHSTTIGIRRSCMERTVLPRQELTVETPHGLVRGKLCRLGNGEKRWFPEYESVAALCRARDLPFCETFQEVKACWKRD